MGGKTKGLLPVQYFLPSNMSLAKNKLDNDGGNFDGLLTELLTKGGKLEVMVVRSDDSIHS